MSVKPTGETRPIYTKTGEGRHDRLSGGRRRRSRVRGRLTAKPPTTRVLTTQV